MYEIAYFRFPVCLWRKKELQRSPGPPKTNLKIRPKTPKIHFKNAQLSQIYIRGTRKTLISPPSKIKWKSELYNRMFFLSPCAYRAPMVARAVKKILKLHQKNSKNYSKTVSGPQLGCPDELEDNLMRVWKLRSSSTTSEQQRSTTRSHRTSIFNFCVPRRRHPRQVEPYLTVIWKTVQGESGPFLENASHLWSADFLTKFSALPTTYATIGGAFESWARAW